MAFLELAAAFKFLANTDLAWNPGNPKLFTYDSVLCAWIALSVACGLYLFGLYRLPHDTPIDHLGVGRMLLACMFLALALYMVPAIWRVTPLGSLGNGLIAFLPLDTRVGPNSAQTNGTELTWHRDYQEAWKTATSTGKLIFIDFTGINCTNCRYNEKTVFPSPAVHEALNNYVRVQLYTDSVPDPSLSASASEEQARRNSTLQNETFGDAANPFYAVIRPAHDKPFDETADGKLRLRGTILGTRKGLIPRSELRDFEDFLTLPQKQAIGSAADTNTSALAIGRGLR
jgi:thiol:disulfide interchange protein DsbD